MHTSSDPLPNRHHPAHPMPIQHGSDPVIIHITVCTDQRRKLLDNQGMLTNLRAAWNQAANWQVGTYVVMPDHVHLFCTPGTFPPTGIRPWVSYWKRLVSQSSPTLHPIWQRDCWDTQMRSLDQYTEKLEYVRLNPVRRNLVNHAEEWPFSGEIHQITW